MWSTQENLPIEIFEKIIMHLDITSLKAARQVCEYWKEVVDKSIERSKYIFFEGKIQIEKETQQHPTDPQLLNYGNVNNTYIKVEPFIFKVESHGYREENKMHYDLRIYDFDGNMLFSRSTWDQPHLTSRGGVLKGWIGGFFDLKVDIRRGSKLLFYRKGQGSLVIMDLDTLMETYIERGKEPITGRYWDYADSVKYKMDEYHEDWHDKNSREIYLKPLDCPSKFSYFVEKSSIILVESPDKLTKLSFSM